MSDFNQLVDINANLGDLNVDSEASLTALQSMDTTLIASDTQHTQIEINTAATASSLVNLEALFAANSTSSGFGLELRTQNPITLAEWSPWFLNSWGLVSDQGPQLLLPSGGTHPEAIRHPGQGGSVWLHGTDLNDVAAGTGATAVDIFYIDTNGDPQAEVMITNGITPVQSANSDICHVNSAIVSAVGAGNTNVGLMTINTNVAPNLNIVNVIEPGERLSKQSSYLIPNGFELYLVEATLSAHLIAGAARHHINVYNTLGDITPGNPGFRVAALTFVLSAGQTSLQIPIKVGRTFQGNELIEMRFNNVGSNASSNDNFTLQGFLRNLSP